MARLPSFDRRRNIVATVSLSPGNKLAHYEILEPIGKGGMGEVYRAKDGKLGRDVAIKVLPEEFAQDEERLRRFQREAKVLASLNHPSIAGIYGLEESDSLRFLVLELVPGETLADRIARGPIPVDEALDIAKKIAEALEEAHEQGIVHRDLKPANVKLTPDDKVKVLDFGLAKAFAEEGQGGDAASSMSPTITRDATRVGVILGTAAYMSPEQAKGKRVDRRSDIWAFGAVLYEMLTGKRAFEGEDVSETLAAVIRGEVDWETLPDKTPSSIRLLLRRCLEREPKKRLGWAGDAGLELDEALADTEKTVTLLEPSRGHGVLRATLSVLVAAVALVVLWLLLEPTTTKEVYRLTVTMPEGLSDRTAAVAFSPNGRELVYVGGVEPHSRIYVRALDSLEVRAIPGTESGNRPFFSPDGDWIVFQAALTDETKKVSLRENQPATTLATPEAFAAGSWTESGFVYYGRPLFQEVRRVSSLGGPAEVVAKFDDGMVNCVEVLPKENAVLATVGSDVKLVHLRDGAQEELLEDATCPRYAPSGHLVFARGNVMFAVAFDPDTLSIKGSPVPVLEGVAQARGGSGAPQFSFSSSGHLLYVPQSSFEVGIVRVDREGISEPLLGMPGQYGSPSVSPDGRAIAFHDAASDLWVLEWERGLMRRLTFDSGGETSPIWTPDGERLTFFSVQDGIWSLDAVSADGTGERKRLLELGAVTSGRTAPSDWSPDGTVLVVSMRHPPTATTQTDIIALHVNEDGALEVPDASKLVETTFQDVNAKFSPDGRWIAYESGMIGGQGEVYVQPFPGPGGKIQVSIGGGSDPRWSPAGGELFFRNGDAVFAVAYDAKGDAFTHDAPRELFRGAFVRSDGSYDVFPDGEHFVMLQPGGGTVAPTEGVVVLNWFEELKRLVPVDSD